MRLALAFAVFAVAACGPAPKPEGPIVNEGSGAATPETCCCKSMPMVSDDGRPLYENANRMECSSKQGTCVDEIQCAGAAEPE